jgi:hypothetical protein
MTLSFEDYISLFLRVLKLMARTGIEILGTAQTGWTQLLHSVSDRCQSQSLKLSVEKLCFCFIVCVVILLNAEMLAHLIFGPIV